MRALVQRVRSGSVTIDGRETGRIGPGLVVLLGVGHGDTAADVAWLAEKVANLRLFSDAAGKFNRSALDEQAAVLVVSQFTLYGDCRQGRRPSFTDAAPPAVAAPLYEQFVAALAAHGLATATGVFGAHMLVTIANDGPVTLWLESPRRAHPTATV